MTIDFTCPHCGKQTIVADEYAGSTGPCARCGESITIPGGGKTVGLSPAPIPPKPSQGGWRKPLVVVVACFLPVVLCIGVLLALILPAIQAAREAARRAECQNNLRAISLSLQNYHDTYKNFPAGVMHAGVKGSTERLGPSWWVSTMPFVESRNIYDKLMASQRPGASGNGAFNAENYDANGGRLGRHNLSYMQCPSSPLPIFETETGPVTLPTYVGIAGGCDIATNSPDYQYGRSELGLVAPNTSRVFRNKRKGAGHVPGGIITASGMLPPCQYLSLADCQDGTTNTMIVGEQSDWLRDVDRNIRTKYHGDAGWDTSGTGPPTASTTAGGGFVSGTVQSSPVPLAKEGEPGSPPAAYDCYNITTVRYPPDLKHVLGANPYPGCSEDHGINNPLQSAHPRGVMIVMVDGSVQFISETTDLAVLLRVAIRDDAQNIRLQ